MRSADLAILRINDDATHEAARAEHERQLFPCRSLRLDKDSLAHHGHAVRGTGDHDPRARLEAEAKRALRRGAEANARAQGSMRIHRAEPRR